MATKDEIQSRINSRLTSEATKVEGGTTQDIIGSVSYELANIYDTQVVPTIDNAFVTTADEEHLEIKGNELGLTRKRNLGALVYADISNAVPGAIARTTMKAMTADGLVFNNLYEVLVKEDGTCRVHMQCAVAGLVGNISPNTLTQFVNRYAGFENAEITNLELGYDGVDVEDVEDYRKRILAYLSSDAANSNIADYENWAKSVIGVLDAKALDAMNENVGAGNVHVYISATGNAPVTNELTQRVADYIKSQQIINANLFVFPLNYVSINVNAVVKIRSGYTKDNAIESFNELLSAHLAQNPTTISYLYVSSLLFEAEGIDDVESYTINNGADSIIIGHLERAILGTTTMEE